MRLKIIGLMLLFILMGNSYAYTTYWPGSVQSTSTSSNTQFGNVFISADSSCYFQSWNPGKVYLHAGTNWSGPDILTNANSYTRVNGKVRWIQAGNSNWDAQYGQQYFWVKTNGPSVWGAMNARSDIVVDDNRGLDYRVYSTHRYMYVYGSGALYTNDSFCLQRNR